MKRVLINWYYHRFDLTQFILEYSADTEIVFLYKQIAEEEPGYISNRKNVSVIYWGDYHSPYEMLGRVKPDVVVFADLESFNQISLNIAARNRNIKTFVLQHGVRGAYEVEEALSIAEETENNIQFSGTSRWSFRFLISSLRLQNLAQLPKLLRFIYQRKSGALTTALYKNQFELRRADYYIEFSEDNAGYHIKRDGVPKHRFIITGNPLLDDYFGYLNTHNKTGGTYSLLIDCPFTEANFYKSPGIDAEKKNLYLQKMETWSKNNGLGLKVKLHPLSYESTSLYEGNFIEYVRDVDLKELVANAAVVFFVHFSSVAPVILAYKQCIYFHYSLETHGNVFRELGLTPLPLFDFDERSKDLFEKAVTLKGEAVQQFLFSTDGKASERIKNALFSQE